MAKRTLIDRKSALGENVKIASMTQNLIRRMLNTSEQVEFSERIVVIDEFSDQMLASGYSPEQTRDIVVAGLTGYERKLKKSKEEKKDLHRSAAGSLQSRIKKKLLGRQTWYLDKDKGNAKLGQNSVKKPVKRKPKNKFKDSSPRTVTVLFVFQTPNGELAKRLQKVENDIARITGKRVKIVERSGTMLRRLLHKSNPWAGAKCGRDNCLSCLSGPDNQDCFAKNILYEIKCLDCSAAGTAVYYPGETSRSAFCRSAEHLDGYKKSYAGNILHKHSVDKHKGSKKVNYQFKIVKRFFTALQRMVAEFVRIARRSEQKGIILLNSKGEYSRCTLPRLTVDEGGGGGDGKNSFNSPAQVVGIDSKRFRESKECQGSKTQDISSNEFCTVAQTGSQSAAKHFPVSSCGSETQQRFAKKRKRGT